MATQSTENGAGGGATGVAVITGGAGGLGAAIARRFARSGIVSALWDIDRAKATAVAAELPGARAYRVDVTDYAAVAAATAAVVRDFDRIDILVNNAGANGPIAPLVDYPLDGWRKFMALNLDGVFHCCRAVIPVMQERGYGRVVDIASSNGIGG